MTKKIDSFKDALGYTTVVGDKVVYNLSGNLALGIVESITATRGLMYSTYTGRTDNYMLPTVTVKFVAGPGYHTRGYHKSKVKNLKGIMRIDSIL